MKWTSLIIDTPVIKTNWNTCIWNKQVDSCLTQSEISHQVEPVKSKLHVFISVATHCKYKNSSIYYERPLWIGSFFCLLIASNVDFGFIDFVPCGFKTMYIVYL